MRMQVDIGFEELLQLAKQLPQAQWMKLKSEVDKEQHSQVVPGGSSIGLDGYERMLLNKRLN
jgi:hypothetical protein